MILTPFSKAQWAIENQIPSETSTGVRHCFPASRAEERQLQVQVGYKRVLVSRLSVPSPLFSQVFADNTLRSPVWPSPKESLLQAVEMIDVVMNPQELLKLCFS